MAKDKSSLEPKVMSGVMCPEFHADYAKVDVTVGGVKIWAYSDQHEPVGNTTARVPAAIVALPLAAFDVFIADCLRIRARLLELDGEADSVSISRIMGAQ